MHEKTRPRGRLRGQMHEKTLPNGALHGQMHENLVTAICSDQVLGNSAAFEKIPEKIPGASERKTVSKTPCKRLTILSLTSLFVFAFAKRGFFDEACPITTRRYL
jgi:hypothetical protein